jgi:hypothetical protein
MDENTAQAILATLLQIRSDVRTLNQSVDERFSRIENHLQALDETFGEWMEKNAP